jgi:hypothetical protein
MAAVGIHCFASLHKNTLILDYTDVFHSELRPFSLVAEFDDPTLPSK